MTSQTGREAGLKQFGDIITPYQMVNAGAPLSGSTAGTYRNFAQPGALLFDKTNRVVYINEGTLASPYWTPLSFDQPGIRAVWTDFRDVGDIIAVTNTDAETILRSGLRVFGLGKVETDSGLTVASVAEVGNVASIITTNEIGKLLALSMGDTVALVQPDVNCPAVIDVEFTHNSAITLRSTFCGFLGTVADALAEPVTGGTVTLTLVQDDLAGMFQDTGLTDADGIFLPHNKSNAAATIATTATGVDLSQTIAAAGTYQRWRAELAANGNITVFINRVEVGTIAIALDVVEECMPVFYIASQAAATKQADIKRIAMWLQRV